MKISALEMEKTAEEALRACLEEVPFLKIQRILKKGEKDGMQPDLLVEVASPAGHQILFVEVKANGQPRYVRQATNQLYRYRQKFPNAYGVFLAPYISPRSAGICTEEGIGYVDLSGNCRLCFDQVFIKREGQSNPFAQKRDLRSLYSPRATRVLRVLLTHPKRAWKVVELAGEAQVSLGQASNVKRLLEDREWLRVGAEGFTLERPEELLLEWAENYSFRKNPILDCYSLERTAEFEAQLAEYCARNAVRYALTGFSGAVRIAPAVRYQRSFAYLEGNLEEIARQLRLKEVPGGANVSLLSPYDEGVFYGTREVEGIRVASPIQVYLDLIGFRGRGEEAAQPILERIRSQW